MGRTNRSRKRRDEMNKIKKARYEAKELIRLKKTLGLTDAEGNEIMKNISEVATLTILKKTKKSKEEQELEHEMQEAREKAKGIEIVNDKTGKLHVYNSKTMKDQYGSYPPWFKPKKTAKRIRKKEHARKNNFNQSWSTTNVAL